MAQINLKNKEIQLKIVYYGPGRGGKTTSLEHIQQTLAERAGKEMVKLKGNENRTLFFDFYPLKVGTVKGYSVRVQLYTVPGQNRLQPLRRLVLKGVDSIVFVADAMDMQRKHNIASFQNLLENLAHHGQKLSNLPFIVQLNKVDLAEEDIPVITLPTLKADLAACLNEDHFIENVPFFETSAASGKNILRTLEAIIKKTVKQLDFDAIAQKS